MWAPSPDAQRRPGADARAEQPAAGNNQALHAPTRQQALPAVLSQSAAPGVRRQVRRSAQSSASLRLCAGKCFFIRSAVQWLTRWSAILQHELTYRC